MSTNTIDSIPVTSRPLLNKIAACEEVRLAAISGNVGDMVAKHEKLILHYYVDVQNQAAESFRAAKKVAYIGFAVLIFTWLYTLGFDLARLFPRLNMPPDHKFAVIMGGVSAGLIEFIAAVNFWLYSKASKQFAAFHICLERTHRYLVAYKIAEETGSRREDILEHLACIMASAPMITNDSASQTTESQQKFRKKQKFPNPS